MKKDKYTRLRDAVLKMHKEVQEAMDEDSEVTIGGNGANAFEVAYATNVLVRLIKAIDKE
jgi:hypothetical protein